MPDKSEGTAMKKIIGQAIAFTLMAVGRTSSGRNAYPEKSVNACGPYGPGGASALRGSGLAENGQQPISWDSPVTVCSRAAAMNGAAFFVS